MKANDRLRSRLAFRNLLTFATLVMLAVGESWLLTTTWSDWEQHKGPVRPQPNPIVLPVNALPLP